MPLRSIVIGFVLAGVSLVIGCGKTVPTASPTSIRPPTVTLAVPTEIPSHTPSSVGLETTQMANTPAAKPTDARTATAPAAKPTDARTVTAPTSTSTAVQATNAPPLLPTDTPQPATPSLQTTAPRTDGDLRITIVYDNQAYDPGLKTAWGFAALIEYGDETLLFDTGGDGPTLLANMEQLGIEPSRIGVVMLSHIHTDHTGGLSALIKAGARPTVYVLPSFPDDFKRQVAGMADLVEVEPGQSVARSIFSTGEIAGVPDAEQALVVTTDAGLVIVTGCAHPGIVQMVRKAREQLGGHVRLVVGGFHLLNASDADVTRVLSNLRSLGVEQVAPTHCTGEKAMAMFASEYGANYIEAGAGRVILLESVPDSHGMDPYRLISQESLFGYIGGLTTIQPYSGWRNSTSEGEAEALDWEGFDVDVVPFGQPLSPAEWEPGHNRGRPCAYGRCGGPGNGRGNAVPLAMEKGLVLARAGGTPIAGLVDHGSSGGQVLVLGDVGILGADWDQPVDLHFWQNLARYAASR